MTMARRTATGDAAANRLVRAIEGLGAFLCFEGNRRSALHIPIAECDPRTPRNQRLAKGLASG